MRSALPSSALAAMALVLAPGSRAVAQQHDHAFCAMVDGIGARTPERVGDVVSGTTGAAAVVVTRDVAHRAQYVWVVALSAPATEASLAPSAIAGEEAPHREGLRVAHDFHPRASGSVSLSFRAPPGTAYHAALYRLTSPGEAGLGLRAWAQAIHGGGRIDVTGRIPPPRPPDCRFEAPAELAGPPIVGDVVVSGPLDRDAVVTLVTNGMRSMSGCTDVFGRQPLTLHLVVGASGRVESATASEPGLGGCMARIVRRWGFAPSAGVTTIDVPITFAPAR